MSTTCERVLVALSGGVDSAVAAAILKRQGYDVTGVHLSLASVDAGVPLQDRAARNLADARRIAEKLAIELVVVDAAELFEPIIDYFAAEYAAGRTPNPCVRCNAQVKFAKLIELADQRGAGFVATGHHARMSRRGATAAILRSRSGQKDQSYALFALPRGILDRVLLPIGEVDDKDSVRRIARDLGLGVQNKPDSQEICFLGGSDYTPLLVRRAPQALRGGQIVDAQGRVVAEHDGYGRFTVGQRRGLRYAAGVPMYVARIDAAAARVHVAPRERLLKRHLRASGANWHFDPPEAFDAAVKIRYNHRAVPARVRMTGAETFEVDFHEPVMAVTPGQAAVAYDGERLLGGGWIE